MHRWVHKEESQVTSWLIRALKTICTYYSQEAGRPHDLVTKGLGFKNPQIRKQGLDPMWNGDGIQAQAHFSLQTQDLQRVDISSKRWTRKKKKKKRKILWWQREIAKKLVGLFWIWSGNRSTLKKLDPQRICNNGPAPQISTPHI